MALKKRIMLWDIESYIYRACASCKELVEVKPFIFQEQYNLKNGIDYINTTRDRLAKKVKASKIIVALGADTNFRKSVYPQYKEGRKPKPLMYELLLDYILNTFEVYSLPTLEADDVISVIATDPSMGDNELVVVTIDKDLKTIPNVELLRDLDKDSEIEWISQDYAEYNLYYQTIAGDPTDGYKGVPGFGAIKTSDWLRNNPTCTLDDIKQLYIDNTGSDEGFAINYRLAKLVSFDEYDFEKGEVKNIKSN